MPVRISGPYTALSYKLDFNEMIKDVAQQKIDEKKEELKSKAQDKLKEPVEGPVQTLTVGLNPGCE